MCVCAYAETNVKKIWYKMLSTWHTHTYTHKSLVHMTVNNNENNEYGQ